MSELYIGLGLLSMVALLAVVWPMLRPGRLASELRAQQAAAAQRQDANVSLYKEHLAELDASLARAAIDQAQYQVLLLELQQGLLADSERNETQAGRGNLGFSKAVVLSMALVLPVAGLVYYQVRGAAQDVEIAALAQEKFALEQAAFQDGRSPSKAPARELIAKLEARLATHPENQQNWYLLARIAMEQQDFLLAANAYQNILSLAPESGGIMAQLAQALFLANNNRITPDITAMVDAALELAPDNTTALGLAGIAAFEQKDYAATIAYWQRAVSLTGPQSAGAQALMGGIARAEALLAESGAEELQQGLQAEAAGDQALSLAVNVSLAEGLALAPGDTVFIYARAWGGAKVPLAIQKAKVADLPMTVVLDNTMAMVPGMNLSSAEALEVLARVSSSGQAIAQKGDWIGSSERIDVTALPANVSIRIERQLP